MLRRSTRDYVNFWGVKVPFPNQIIKQPDAWHLATKQLSHYFESIGIGPDNTNRLLNKIAKLFLDNNVIDKKLEKVLQQEIDFLNPYQKIKMGLEARASLIYKQISSLIQGRSIFDYGCGDSLVALELSNKYHVETGDIIDYRWQNATKLPFYLIEPQGILPFNENSFDTVLLLTVLHHAENPQKIISEAMRITKSRILVIESVFNITDRINLTSDLYLQTTPISQKRLGGFLALNSTEQLAYCSFIDWFYNRILHNDISLPYNYNTPKAWNNKFKSMGAKQITTYYLGLDQISVPEFHTLHVVDII